MANVTVAVGEVSSGEVALTASTVSTVTFTENIGSVSLINADTTIVWFTVDGTTPTVGGRGSWPLPAGAVIENKSTVNSSGTDVVKLISSGTPTVIVTRGD